MVQGFSCSGQSKHWAQGKQTKKNTQENCISYVKDVAMASHICVCSAGVPTPRATAPAR